MCFLCVWHTHCQTTSEKIKKYNWETYNVRRHNQQLPPALSFCFWKFKLCAVRLLYFCASVEHYKPELSFGRTKRIVRTSVKLTWLTTRVLRTYVSLSFRPIVQHVCLWFFNGCVDGWISELECENILSVAAVGVISTFLVGIKHIRLSFSYLRTTNEYECYYWTYYCCCFCCCGCVICGDTLVLQRHHNIKLQQHNMFPVNKGYTKGPPVDERWLFNTWLEEEYD